MPKSIYFVPYWNLWIAGEDAFMTNGHTTGLGRRDILKLTAAGAALATAGLISSKAAAADDALSLKGKRIAISATGTDHYFDLQAYNAQIDEEIGRAHV